MRRTRSREGSPSRHSRQRESRNRERVRYEVNEGRVRRERRSRYDSRYSTAYDQSDGRRSLGSSRVQIQYGRQSSPRRTYEYGSSHHQSRSYHSSRYSRYEERREPRHRSRSPRRERGRDRAVRNTTGGATTTRKIVSHRVGRNNGREEIVVVSKKQGGPPAGQDDTNAKASDISVVYEKVVIPSKRLNESHRFNKAGRSLEQSTTMSNYSFSTNDLQQEYSSATRSELSEDSGSCDSFDWKNGKFIYHNGLEASTNPLDMAERAKPDWSIRRQSYAVPSKYPGYPRMIKKTNYEKSTSSKSKPSSHHGPSNLTKDRIEQMNTFYAHQFSSTGMRGRGQRKSVESMDNLDASSISDVSSFNASQIQVSRITSRHRHSSYSPRASDKRGRESENTTFTRRSQSRPVQQRSIKVGMGRNFADAEQEYVGLLNNDLFYTSEMSSGFVSEGTTSSPGAIYDYDRMRDTDEETSLITTSSNDGRRHERRLRSAKIEMPSDEEYAGIEMFSRPRYNLDNRKSISPSIDGKQKQSNRLLHDVKPESIDFKKNQEGSSAQQMKLELLSNGMRNYGANLERRVSLPHIKTSPVECNNQEDESSDTFFNERTMMKTPFNDWDDEDTVLLANFEAKSRSKVPLDAIVPLKAAAEKDQHNWMELFPNMNIQGESKNGGWKKPCMIDLTQDEFAITNPKRGDLAVDHHQQEKPKALEGSPSEAAPPFILEDPRLTLSKYKDYWDNKQKETNEAITLSPQKKSLESENGTISQEQQDKEVEPKLMEASDPPPTGNNTDALHARKMIIGRLLSGSLGNARIVKKSDTKEKAPSDEAVGEESFRKLVVKELKFKKNSGTITDEELTKYPNAVLCKSYGKEWVRDLLEIDEGEMKEMENKIISNPDPHKLGIREAVEYAREHREYLRRRTELYRQSVDEQPKEPVFKMRIPRF